MQITVPEISERLADRAEDVCLKLLPGGHRVNGSWKAGDVSGQPGKSLEVHLTGDHRGKWRDWAAQENHGDLIDLFQAVHGYTKPEAVRAAKEFLGIYDPPAEKKAYTAPPERASVVPIANGTAMKWLREERKLTKEIIELYRVHVDNEEKAIVFPSYNLRGELVNRSYRTLDKKVHQDKGCAPCLFGWHAMPEYVFTTRAIIIAEGQLDAMTWMQWGVPAVSMPNGGGMTWIDYEWDNLAIFDRIYLAYDNDEAGKKMLEQAAAKLGAHRCFILTTSHKDANDALKAGATSDDAGKWIAEAKQVPVEGLILGKDMTARVARYMKPKPPPFTIDFMAGKTPDEGFYFRDAEMTAWSGQAGDGKSTMLATVQLSLITIQVPFFICSLEYKAEKLCEMLAKIAYRRTIVSSDEVSKFLTMFGHLFTFADVVGSIEPKRLLNLMNAAYSRHGAKHFFIDSLMRVSGLEEDYPAQGHFVNELSAIAKKTNGHVHLVAHPRKHDEDLRTRKMDIKGSSMIVNNVDNMVVMRRNSEKKKLKEQRPLTPEENESMHDAEFSVEKQRETGWLGVIKLRFNPSLKIFDPFVPPIYAEYGRRSNKPAQQSFSERSYSGERTPKTESGQQAPVEYRSRYSSKHDNPLPSP